MSGVRECPSCGREVEGPRESCPSCWATLVDDADATITCEHCGWTCPSRMHSCPGCLALLRPDAEVVEDVLTAALAAGRRLHRPVGRRPFESGPSCTVLRLAPNGGLVVCGADGLIEANLIGRDLLAVPPLRCETGGRTLFRLDAYQAADRSLVAVGDDGAALATFLRVGSVLDRLLDVRDETSAPVARFEPVDGAFRLVETGGGVLATGVTRDVELERWIDDEWSLTTQSADLPLKPLAFVALAVAAKVLFGRPKPVPLQEQEPDELTEFTRSLFRRRS